MTSLLIAEPDADPEAMDAAYKIFRRKRPRTANVWSAEAAAQIAKTVGLRILPAFKIDNTYWYKNSRGVYRPWKP